MPEVWINPSGGGRLTPEALLQSEGSVDVFLDANRFPDEKFCIFHIAGDDFWFNLGFIDGRLIFQRREYTVEMSQSFFRKLKGNRNFIASWTPDKLILLLGPRGFFGPSTNKVLPIEPRPAPASLFRWAREQALIRTTEYESEAEFVSRVHSGLASLQAKIDAMHTRDIFWDIEYRGNRVARRRPKRETDLHGVILALLSDHFFLSSIDVIPEVKTGAGRSGLPVHRHCPGTGACKGLRGIQAGALAEALPRHRVATAGVHAGAGNRQRHLLHPRLPGAVVRRAAGQRHRHAYPPRHRFGARLAIEVLPDQGAPLPPGAKPYGVGGLTPCGHPTCRALTLAASPVPDVPSVGDLTARQGSPAAR